MPRRVWETVETETRKIRMAKTEGREKKEERKKNKKK